MKERFKRIGYKIGMWIAGRTEPPYQCYWGRRALAAEKEANRLRGMLTDMEGYSAKAR